MQNIETAERIVAIQTDLSRVDLPREDRILLTGEQRRLWDKEFPGVGYDRIALDVWRVRSYS